MKVKVKKWGNSPSVRIPAAIMGAAHLRLDQELEMREEGGCVILEPVRQVAFELDDLESLLDGITEDNLHGELATGEPVGREVW